MARFASLFSGSSGNSTYIGCGAGGILVDVGVSAKGVQAALAELDVEISSIHAIFVTHEHCDHIAGLRVFASRHNIPVYASRQTLAALEEAGALTEKIQAFPFPEDGVTAAGIHITRFATSHDCEGSSGYTAQTPDGRRVAVCTDLGFISDDVRAALSGCDLVLLESNHDVRMLQNGPYPYYLKRRILGDHGHLSNDDCAHTLPWLVERGTTRFVLGHLSRENNYPELALATARAQFTSAGMAEGDDYLLSAAAAHNGRMTVL